MRERTDSVLKFFQSNSQGEMFASISGLSNSMMGKFDFDSSISPHSSSQVCYFFPFLQLMCFSLTFSPSLDLQKDF